MNFIASRPGIKRGEVECFSVGHDQKPHQINIVNMAVIKDLCKDRNKTKPVTGIQTKTEKSSVVTVLLLFFLLLDLLEDLLYMIAPPIMTLIERRSRDMDVRTAFR